MCNVVSLQTLAEKLFLLHGVSQAASDCIWSRPNAIPSLRVVRRLDVWLYAALICVLNILYFNAYNADISLKPRTNLYQIVRKVKLLRILSGCADRQKCVHNLVFKHTKAFAQFIKFCHRRPSAIVLWPRLGHHIGIHAVISSHICTILKLCCTVDIGPYNLK